MQRLFHHLKHLLLPCLGFSAAAGVLSALFITLFKIGAEHVIRLSERLFDAARATPLFLLWLLPSAALAGLLASLLLSFSHSCKGGGIPTSVAAIGGIVPFHWIKSVLILPLSALLTFLCGLPLGTEGPCVQMGTAIGDGVTRCPGLSAHRGWRRYIMTGGAGAGFAVATGSPITAILFSMEELHKHFSPLLLSVVSVSVMTAQGTVHLLAHFGIGQVELFSLPAIPEAGLGTLFAPLLLGLGVGLASILFTRLYHLTDALIRAILRKIPRGVLFPLLFAAIALLGFFFSDALGTGHDLTERLFTGSGLWALLLLIFLFRMLTMMLSNTAGVTGGIFLPMLAFGAILGALFSDGMIALGWLPADYRVLGVVLGISAFLGATSRIPITAAVFAIEALGGIHNVLPIVIATTVALLTVEISGLEDFTDTVIRSKVRSFSKGKSPAVIEASFTVARDAFAVGKELRDILWPASSRIIAYEHADAAGGGGIAAGDVITVRYETYLPADTAAEFRALVGAQSEETERAMHPCPEETDNE